MALLGAMAAIMSLRPEMSLLEKFGWILIVAFLLRTEIRAIGEDRGNAIAQALADRQKQDDHFAQVLKGQHDDFSATAQSLTQSYMTNQQHFDTTVTKLNNASRQVQKTIEQTRPTASVQFHAGDMILDSMDVAIRTRAPYRNDGRETARTIFLMVKRYIASSDSKIARQQITEEFEKRGSII